MQNVPTSEHETRARLRKALLLLAAASAAGATVDTLQAFTDSDWQAAADAAGVPAPSEQTRPLVIAQAQALPTVADPFDGLVNA